MQTFAFNPSRRSLAQPGRIENICLKNFSQHLACALVHLRDAWMIVNIFIQEFSQSAVRFQQSLTVTNQRPLLLANFIGTLHSKIDNCRGAVVTTSWTCTSMISR